MKQIRSDADQMTALLKGNVRTTDPADYIDAKNFLTSLANEARFPVN